jgi:hypothetical protein
MRKEGGEGNGVMGRWPGNEVRRSGDGEIRRARASARERDREIGR